MHAPDEFEDDDAPASGAEGAAVFPLIGPELQVNPLLLALLHAMVFIDGSTDEIICPDAADEAMQYLVTYLHRLQGSVLERVREDMTHLLTYAKQQAWPKEQQTFLKSFLTDYGMGPKT
jgi:hypothetical protein